MDPKDLNYHHLYYFWAVAKDGNLTRAAKQLHVSQSALSAQISQLEDRLKQPLFHRIGRSLALSEAGRIALAYAERIFATGAEMVGTLAYGRSAEHELRIGSVATLSRNFQESFVAPLLGRDDTRLRLMSASLDELVERLADHSLDLILVNQAIQSDEIPNLRCHLLARQNVSFVAQASLAGFRFPEDAGKVPLLLPGRASAIRGAFDMLCGKYGVTVRIAAEVDDMAMMRLLARDMNAVALVPTVVVRDELNSGRLKECCVVPDLHENFYAVVLERQFQHPLVGLLLARTAVEILGLENKEHGGW